MDDTQKKIRTLPLQIYQKFYSNGVASGESFSRGQLTTLRRRAYNGRLYFQLNREQ